MASPVAGIDKWAAGIRHRMANDPGRQDLDDHILCNGFLFLDEYLEDILIGARSEPIIELTKTPGRRKDMSKKDRVATTASVKKLQSSDKENLPLLKSPTRTKKAPTSFHKALLKANRENQPSAVPPISNGFKPDPQNPFGNLVMKDTDDEQEEEAVAVLVTPPSTRMAVFAELKEFTLLPSLSETSLAKPSDIQLGPPSILNPSIANPAVELSAIAEGDENDMSRGSLALTRPTGPIIRDKEISYHITADPTSPKVAPVSPVTVSHDPNSIDDDDDIHAPPSALDRTFNDSEATSTASSFPIDPYARDYETCELPQVVAEHASTEQPHPYSPPASTLIRKASIPVLPSLPGPSPLRKSTRDSVIGGPAVGNARSSATASAVTGTRSSWLTKARDVTAKRASVVFGVKRKSDDLTETDHTATEAYVRATKVAKTQADGGVSDALSDPQRPQGKLAIQPFKAIVPPKRQEQPNELPAAHAVTPDGNSEGMMNILKRTVEGLGARVGKSMGKSLGGAAATAAAAEAKAAAEVRLAQREAKGPDGTKQARLSVSDLVGAFEHGGAGKGNERGSSDIKSKALSSPPSPPTPQVILGPRASISTTPPDSPPATQSQVSSTPGHPAYTIPKFTVQRPMVQEPSLGLLETQQSQQSQPSTQSTFVSSIFDDHSIWPHSSLGTDYTTSQGFSQSKDFEVINDHETSDMAKETHKAQSQVNLVTLHNVITSAKARQAKVTPSISPEDTESRLPGSFEPHDEDMEPGNAVQQDDKERNETNGEFGSGSPDAAEPKLKTGFSQDNSTTSIQPGLVVQTSTLLSKVMGSSISNTLGASKRSKPEPVKSIQLAAAAAKKQQEEADRKAARLREMDKRRAAIASKKADQDVAEKSKQQGDRHKRERDEAPERNAKTIIKKAEEEGNKKRKVIVEIEKKPQSKKGLKDKELGSSRLGKPTLNTSLSQSQLAFSGPSKMLKPSGLPASVSQPSIKLVGPNQGEPKPVALPKAGGPNDIEDIRQPSQTLHAQMQARVQAQLLQARQDETVVPSESIELPDINSEYSNSDDEDRPRTFDPPDWAQSPVLGLALQSQSRLNPDDIFGPVRPLRMEEIFKTRHSRFRARTSSANWAGTDELTTDEQRQYAKRMGYLD